MRRGKKKFVHISTCIRQAFFLVLVLFFFHSREITYLLFGTYSIKSCSHFDLIFSEATLFFSNKQPFSLLLVRWKFVVFIPPFVVSFFWVLVFCSLFSACQDLSTRLGLVLLQGWRPGLNQATGVMSSKTPGGHQHHQHRKPQPAWFWPGNGPPCKASSQMCSV